MKTEINIDDRLAERLKQAAEFSHISFAMAVERAISAGLPTLPQPPERQIYKTPGEFRRLIDKIQEEDDLEKVRRSGG